MSLATEDRGDRKQSLSATYREREAGARLTLFRWILHRMLHEGTRIVLESLSRKRVFLLKCRLDCEDGELDGQLSSRRGK